MQLILVNQLNEPVGQMEKMEVHRRGLLHRAFSIFIVNSSGQMLLQQRAAEKYHSGGLWSNACCSHPLAGEETLAAAHRRLLEEMGFDTDLQEVFSFIYRVNFENGLIEHEYDHVFVGRYDGPIAPDEKEVSGYKFVTINFLLKDMQENKHSYTEWFHIAVPKLIPFL